jgi:hypothetical protein
MTFPRLAKANTFALRTLASALLLFISAAPSAFAQDPVYRYLTGRELLSDSAVAFPDGPPALDGDAVILGPATTTRSIMVEVDYPLGGNWPAGSLSRAAVGWEMVRLACDGVNGCNPSAADHDPAFFIRQGDLAYAWWIADDNSGMVLAGSINMRTATVNGWLDNEVKRTNTNFFPAIGQRYDIDIAFTFEQGTVWAAMNFVIPGRPTILSTVHTFSFFGGFDPMKPFSLGILHDDNRGELYKLVGARIAPAPIPEPASLLMLLSGLLVVLGMRRKA